MGFVDPSSTFGVNCENDTLDPDGCLQNCGDLVEVASLEEQQLGDPAGVAPPVVAQGFAADTTFCGEHCPNGDQSPVSFGNSPTEDNMVLEEHEAIVMGAVSTGTPWFLSGWAGGTKVEFMIDTRCQVTILATSVFDQMCAVDQRLGSRLRPCR